jgi:5-methylcytosine-specific restriction endonuclease McrA
LIAPHLTNESSATWLAIARHKSAHEIRQQIADRKPKPDVATSIRRVPARRRTSPQKLRDTQSLITRPASEPDDRVIREGRPATAGDRTTSRKRESGALSKAICEPLGAQRYCVRFVADEAAHQQLQELRSLLRPSVPDGDVAKILARAIGVLLREVRKQKIGSCSSPRPARPAEAGVTAEPSNEATRRSKSERPSRHIPAAIRREVWRRDGGRCTFRSRAGRKCGSVEFLEFHHRVPWACCREHTASNIGLRCRAHNQYEAELAFGSAPMARYRKGSAVDRVGDGIGAGVAEGDRGAPAILRQQLDSNPDPA